MTQKYEYKFVRMGEGWLGVKREAVEDYQRIIQEHARDGWRLVQVFAPPTGVHGVASYFEVILERDIGT